MMRLLGMVLLVICLSVKMVHADEGYEAVGEAQIKEGDKAEAKKAAIAHALRLCVEKAFGMTVESEFTAEQKEFTAGQQTNFESKVRDALTQKSSGFVQSYEVLEESVDADVLKVRVKAQIFSSKIKAEAKKMLELIQAAGNPKLMLVIQEVTQEEASPPQVSGSSILAGYLERELLNRGFEIAGNQAARRLSSGSIEAFDAWLSDNAATTATAQEAGADLLIAGRVEISDKGRVTEAQAGGLEALVGQVRVEIRSLIRGINAATGDLFSSKPVQLKSMGANVERAVNRAFQGRGQNLVSQICGTLVEDLQESFRKTIEQGQAYVVRLSGITSFRNQGKRFIEMMHSLSGVSAAEQKSFQDGTLVLDVRCRCNAQELQERVLSAAADAHLTQLDIENISGKQLSFHL